MTTPLQQLDDGWPESVEQQGLLLLVLRYYITRQYIKDVLKADKTGSIKTIYYKYKTLVCIVSFVLFFTYRTFYTQTLLHRSCYTQELLHTETFTHRRFYAQTRLHTEVFAHKSFYTRKVLHTDTDHFAQALTHRRLYTQTLLHADIFTRKHFYTQKRSHTDVFTHRSVYTQTFLHTEAFAHRLLSHRRFHIQKFLHTDAFTRRRLYTQALFTTKKEPFFGPQNGTKSRRAKKGLNSSSWTECSYGHRFRHWSQAENWCIVNWRSCYLSAGLRSWVSLADCGESNHHRQSVEKSRDTNCSTRTTRGRHFRLHQRAHMLSAMETATRRWRMRLRSFEQIQQRMPTRFQVSKTEPKTGPLYLLLLIMTIFPSEVASRLGRPRLARRTIGTRIKRWWRIFFSVQRLLAFARSFNTFSCMLLRNSKLANYCIHIAAFWLDHKSERW